MTIETDLPQRSTHHATIADSSAMLQSTRYTQPTQHLLQTSACSRLLGLGPQALSDVELLSLVLRTNGRSSTHDLSAKLLTTYGSLRTLLLADRHAARQHGLTTSSYVALQTALEISRRHYCEQMMTGPAPYDPCATREYLRRRLRDLPYEVFAAIYLDTHYRVLHYGELFRGSLAGAIVHPREVVKDALSHNAAAAIVAHNHPSGVAEPSPADRQLTVKLKEALALVEIRLIDHLIIGDDCITSLAERGLL